ncbi:hypothetical protein GXW82_44615 [Streptacidiphilus sp. 4-A2]|nr:hypothetical protein [Streptacidiphilus sp. 4-A2]
MRLCLQLPPADPIGGRVTAGPAIRSAPKARPGCAGAHVGVALAAVPGPRRRAIAARRIPKSLAADSGNDVSDPLTYFSQRQGWLFRWWKKLLNLRLMYWRGKH